ncbi:MAG: hypothetical protein GPJ54_19995 [Candidatus Heimdallarchaeota archaeon]|nr:hypothetical protein [Candidatus Heimdallarchaeota archaeon]
MFQFEREILGQLEDSDLRNLIKRLKTGKIISRRDYSIRSLEIKKVYQKYSLEVYFSDIFEVDLAIYHKMIAFYYLRMAQFDTALHHLSESIKLFTRHKIVNEVLIETYRYLAFLYHRSSNFAVSLDSYQSEFINRLLVLPCRQLSGLVEGFIKNFVNRSISLRHLSHHVRSSNNSIYAYNLLLILLQENDLDEEDMINYQNQLITAMLNFSISLVHQGIPYELVLSNLEYTFHIFENNHLLELNLVLEIYDLKFRCLLALNKSLDVEFSKLNDFIVRKYNKSTEQLFMDTSPESDIQIYLLLLRLKLLIKLDQGALNEFEDVKKSLEVKLNDPTAFKILYGIYLILFMSISKKGNLVPVLDNFRALCENNSFIDTAFVFAVVLYKLTDLQKYKIKIDELSKYKFRFHETREYINDKREALNILNDFSRRKFINAQVFLEELFEYKLSSQNRDVEYGTSNYELTPDDLDNSAIHKRKNL